MTGITASSVRPRSPTTCRSATLRHTGRVIRTDRYVAQAAVTALFLISLLFAVLSIASPDFAYTVLVSIVTLILMVRLGWWGNAAGGIAVIILTMFVCLQLAILFI
jgi:hypothetical protein